MIRDCTKLIQSHPDYALACMPRREAHLLRGDTEKAEADCRAAVWGAEDDEEEE